MINKSLVRLYGIWATAVLLFTLYCIVLGYHTGPFRDMWVVMDYIRQWFEGGAGIDDLFALHGKAHRLVIPKVLFLIEYGLFKGSNVFLIGVALLTQTGVVLLVTRWLWLDTRLFAQQRYFLLALSVILMFNPTQLENFLYTFDVQWFLTTAAAVWALSCAVRYFEAESKSLQTTIVVSGLLAAFISMFSSFSGVCLLLVLPLIIWTYKRSFIPVLCSVLISAAIIFIYIQGPFSEASGWIGIKDQEVTLWIVIKFTFLLISLWMKWIALYLGSPLGRDFFWLGALFSWGSLLFLAFNMQKLLRGMQQQFSALQKLFLFMAVFAAIVGFATGWGRMHFINTADEDRYQSVVLIYWLGILGFACLQAFYSRQCEAQVSSTPAGNLYKNLPIAVALFWTCVVIPYAGLKDARFQLGFFDKVREANQAIAVGYWGFHAIKNTLILGDKNKRINRPEKHAAFLRQQGWGVFATDGFQSLGQTLQLPQQQAPACHGRLFSAGPIKAELFDNGGEGYGGIRLQGSGWEMPGKTPYRRVLVTDSSDVIVGIGALKRPRASLLPLGWQPAEQARWVAHTVDLRAYEGSLSIWGEGRNRQLCRISATTFPAETR